MTNQCYFDADKHFECALLLMHMQRHEKKDVKSFKWHISHQVSSTDVLCNFMTENIGSIDMCIYMLKYSQCQNEFVCLFRGLMCGHKMQRNSMKEIIHLRGLNETE